MRILFVCQAFAPHFEGGTERVARAHAHALVEAGHEVRVVAAAPVGAELRAEVDGLAVSFVEEALDGHDPLGEQLLIERPARRAGVLVAARDFRPDVVHIQHHASLSLGLTAALAESGARIFVSLHDLFVTCPRFFRDPPAGISCPPPGAYGNCAACLAPEAPGFEAHELETALAERARRMRAELEGAAGLFAPSASHAARVEALVGFEPGRIAVLANGLTVNLERVPPAPLPSGPEQPLELLCFGHRVATKGVVELVEAASRAAAKARRPLRLTMLGAALEPGLDTKLASLAGPLGLILAGPYDRAQLSAAAARAHVAVFPSKALESYGLVVDEALALGLPVLVADAGALGERFGGAGRLLPRPVDPAALAVWTAALVELAADPARIDAWRARIPDRMPGPREAAALLLEHYSPPRS